MCRVLLIIIAFLSLPSATVLSQRIGQKDPIPQELIIQVKNIHDFIGRFNFELDPSGEPLSNEFKSKYNRGQLLETLFNKGDTMRKLNQLELQFINDVMSSNKKMLKDTNLFTKLSCLFEYDKDTLPIDLLLQYTYDGDNAYRWAIVKVNSKRLNLFGSTNISEYIPPNNDEIGFSRLEQALKGNMSPISLAPNHYKYDQLSTYLFLLEEGLLVFRESTDMKYIYKGIDGWEIHLKDFNRPGYNSGWLISDLIQTK